ncbi:MAG: hypothetical protein EOO70_03820 [Myxococcaceae bacterium]|nr:MAG: hypothetical protein EOO70_03820 [Myxococcaceae bacterium]
MGNEVHPMMAATWHFPPYSVRRLIDLTDGSTRNAMRGRSTTGYPYPKGCNGGWVIGEPRLSNLFPLSTDGEQKRDYSLWMRPDGTLGGGGLRPFASAGVSYFFSDALQGSQFVSGGSIQRIDLGGGPTETIDTDVAFKAGAGQGQLAAWLTYDTKTNQKLRAWAPDGLGPRTLLDIPVEPDQAGLSFFLSMSDTRFVGHLATPNPEFDSAKTGLRLWTSPRTDKPGQAKLTASPPLPLPAGSTEIGVGAHQTWGDYVAIQLFTQPGTQQSEGHTRIVHLPTWTSYTLLHGPDYQIGDPRGFTVSQNHAYMALRDKKEGLYDASIVRRYDLTRLAQSASAVQTP